VRASIRLRLTLTYVALLVGATAVLLAMSWWLLGRQLERTMPAEYADAVLAKLGWQYALAIAGSALVALGVGWAAAGRALAPIRSIAGTAKRISENRLGDRVRLAGPRDEVFDLASAFDAMLDRVEGAVEGQRRFAANASHELRTPLTVIKTEAEVALDDPEATVEDLREVARAVVEGADRAEALLDGLLLLAVSNEGTRRNDDVDLAQVTDRSLQAIDMEARAAHVSLRTDVESVSVRGDEPLLERLIGNLVENAVRHGKRGGVARLALSRSGGHAVIRVSNDGPCIAPQALEKLSQPFERLDRGRSRGTGLGLSIVRAITEAHGGSLRLAAPAAGGLDVEVRLPSTVIPT
jgi:signal transduction histidine kinase